MNKKNKKFNIISTIVLIAVLGASLGGGIGIGFANKKDSDFIKFHFNGGSISGEWDISKSTDSSNATEIENSFMRGVLFNKYFKDNKWVEGKWKSAFKKNDNWDVPYILTKSGMTADKLTRDFSESKLLSKTLSESVYKYLIEDDDLNKDTKVQKVITEITNESQKENPGDKIIHYNFFDFKNNNNKLFNEVIDAINQTPKFVDSFLTDMMVYGYLWQKSSSSLYDYNFTEEIAYDKPSIVSSAAIDAKKAYTKKDTISEMSDVWKSLSLIGTKEHDINIKAKDWNDNLKKLNEQDALKDSSVLNRKFSSNSFAGFDGIKMGTPGENTKDDWLNIEKTWKWEKNPLKATTINGDYTNQNVLENSNYYLAKNDNDKSKPTAKGVGAIISKEELNDKVTPEEGTDANIYNYSQLYPFAFAKNIKNNNYSSIKYSLFAKESDGKWTQSNDKETSSYIMDRWFKNTDVPNMNYLGEVYLAEQIIQYHSEDLISKARKFWHDKGFYIELSGKYDSKFGTLIPSDLLK